MSDNTTRIDGRNRFADKATWEIQIKRPGSERKIVLIGGSIDVRDHSNGFMISSVHPTGTDEEHDSAYVARFEGAGLTMTVMFGDEIQFQAALWSAEYWLPGEFEQDAEPCNDKDCRYGNHPVGKYTPPRREFEAGIYELRLRPIRSKKKTK